jgi:dienelactone hydrolase
LSEIEIARERLELKVANSGPMGAYVARPAGTGPHPGLIVFQEAYGVNSHIRNVTDRFAAQGYVAIAPEPEICDRGVEREEEALRECGILKCRSWIFLRRARSV